MAGIDLGGFEVSPASDLEAHLIFAYICTPTSPAVLIFRILSQKPSIHRTGSCYSSFVVEPPPTTPGLA
jgi:hypothetical protein